MLISWLQSPSTVSLEAKKIKSATVSTFSPPICHEVMDQMPWCYFFECCFKPAFSFSSFILIKRLFSSSLLSAIRVILSAYLRLLIFLSAILILACNSSGSAFSMMYSAYKLNKQGDDIWPCTPFPILNQSLFLCLVLTVASWPANRFLRKQVWWSGISISLRIFQFVVIHRVKGFSIVNEAELFYNI